MRTWLKNARKEKGLTLKQAGAALGFTESAYSMVEKGERQKDLGLAYAVKISELFDISLDEIARLEAAPKAKTVKVTRRDLRLNQRGRKPNGR